MRRWTKGRCSCSSAAFSWRACSSRSSPRGSGVPSLVAFLALGMLLGSDGLGGIEFDDAELARTRRHRRPRRDPVRGRALDLLAAPAARRRARRAPEHRRRRRHGRPHRHRRLLPVRPLLARLDPARRGRLVDRRRGRLRDAPLHERRAAPRPDARGRDRRQRPDGDRAHGRPDRVDPGPGLRLPDLALLVVRQIGLGLLVGIVLGFAATWAFARLPDSIGAFAPVASVAAAALSFGAADVIGGSGFLAVYLVGLAVGSTPSRLPPPAGRLPRGARVPGPGGDVRRARAARLPPRLPAVVLPGLALASLLVFLIRPAAVWVSTAFNDFTTRERALLGWAGLRGAVPIVLGTIVLSVGDRERRDDLQRRLLRRRRLGARPGDDARMGRRASRLAVPAPPPRRRRSRSTRTARSSSSTSTSRPTHAIAGAAVRELGLPRSALVAAVAAGRDSIPPRGSTVIQPGDRLFVLVPRTMRADLEDVFARWRRRV